MRHHCSGPAASFGEVQAHCLLSSPTPNTKGRCCIIRLINVHSLSALKGEASNKGDKADLLQEISQYYTSARYLSAGVRKPSTSFSKVQTLRAVGVATCVVERVMEAITRGCGELCKES